MSSESSISLHDSLIRGQVTDLEGTGATTVALILLDAWGARHTNDQRFTLFIPDDRLLEMSLLFHKIAQDLAALIPDGELVTHVDFTEDTISIDEAAEHVDTPHRYG